MAKPNNKRLYPNAIAKPQREHHQLLNKYGVLVNLYLAEDF